MNRRFIPLLVIGLSNVAGCLRGEDGELVRFAPVLLDHRRAELREAPELMEDKEFVLGLVILLTEYEFDFEYIKGEVRVRRMMEWEHHTSRTSTDSVQPPAALYPPEFEDMDFRANLTEKALGVSKAYKAYQKRRRTD